MADDNNGTTTGLLRSRHTTCHTLGLPERLMCDPCLLYKRQLEKNPNKVRAKSNNCKRPFVFDQEKHREERKRITYNEIMRFLC